VDEKAAAVEKSDDGQTDGVRLTDELVKAGRTNLNVCADGMSVAYIDLTLRDLGLGSVSVLSKCVHVQNLDLSHNALTDVSVLSSLPHLVAVDLSHNHLSYILGFRAKGTLRRANLSHNRITHMNDISSRRFLEDLRLDHNGITEIAGVRQLRRLQVLTLSHNKLGRVTGLDNLTLRSLDLSYNRLMMIEGLESLRALQCISLSGNKISSLAGLQDHPVLHDIRIERNNVESLDELMYIANLSCLSYLDLSGCPIEEIECFRLQLLFRVPRVTELNGIQVVAEERVAAANFEDSEHPQYHDTRRDDAQDLDPSLFGSSCQPAEVSAA